MTSLSDTEQIAPERGFHHFCPLPNVIVLFCFFFHFNLQIFLFHQCRLMIDCKIRLQQNYKHDLNALQEHKAWDMEVRDMEEEHILDLTVENTK